jgi:FkbM family methyltransferase
LASGGVVLLEPGHSFTHCFWPAVDNYEPDVRAAVLHFLKPGFTFLDCGANIGYFSVLAGQRVEPGGRVIAIEANPVTYQLLKRNLKINDFGTAIHCALTSEPGKVELFMPRSGGDVYSSIRKGGLVRGNDVESFSVLGRTLDEVVASLQLERVNLVKIDIEGGELEVLRSASRIMRELRPVILCEYGTNTWPAFGATKESLLALIAERNYFVGVFDTIRKRVRRADSGIWDLPYINLILQPKENANDKAMPV